jgi:hypothetical protein
MTTRLTNAAGRADRQRLLPRLQAFCFVLIEAAGFAVTSILIVLGLPLALFLFVAGWDLGGLFAQLDNLAERYLAADAVRRSLFSQDLMTSFAIALGAVTLLRMPRFLKRLMSEFDHQQAGESHNG